MLGRVRRKVMAGKAIVLTIAIVGIYNLCRVSMFKNLYSSSNTIKTHYGNPYHTGCWEMSAKALATVRVTFESSAMTPEMCVHHCGQNNELYAMIKTGTQCWCDSEVDGFQPSEICAFICPGDSAMQTECGGVTSFNMYLVEQNKTVSKIHVLAYMRTGSTFAADIFKNYPNAFYMFEPSHDFRRNFSYYRTAAGTRRQAKIIKHILNCEFSKLPSAVVYRYKEWKTFHTLSKGLDNFVKCENTFGRSALQKIESHQCIQFLKIACERASVRVVKTIRVNARVSQQIHKRDPDVKTIILVRDPRPMFLSIIGFDAVFEEGWRSGLKKSMCGEMADNFKMAESMPNDRVYLLRYEDVTVRPIDVITSMYNFTKLLPVPNNVLLWAKEATNGDGQQRENRIGTVAINSSKKVIEWKQDYTKLFKEMTIIQDECSDMFKAYGYLNIETKDELSSASVPITTPSRTWLFWSVN